MKGLLHWFAHVFSCPPCEIVRIVDGRLLVRCVTCGKETLL